jgi:MOSC domain-containing protein YiiM
MLVQSGGKNKMAVQHLSFDQIEAQINQLAASPRDHGVLEHIVIRLPDERRATPQEAEVSTEGGLEEDRWSRPKSPNPGAQISVMNSRFLKVIAGNDERMCLSGDNLLVDLDLGDENLPTGTRLQIGATTFEVTDVPHTGCQKFERRYGKDALKVVNSEAYKSRRLRGLFVRVIQAGRIQVGDSIRKVTEG